MSSGDKEQHSSTRDDRQKAFQPRGPFITPLAISLCTLAGGVAAIALLFHLAPWTRSTFSVLGNDGHCVLHGEEKQRLLRTGRVQWIFHDMEAEWEATQLHFQVGRQRLEVPDRLVKLISHPSNTELSMSRISGSDLTIRLWGGQGSGSETLTLRYQDGKLARAKLLGVASDQPWVPYP